MKWNRKGWEIKQGVARACCLGLLAMGSIAVPLVGEATEGLGESASTSSERIQKQEGVRLAKDTAEANLSCWQFEEVVEDSGHFVQITGYSGMDTEILVPSEINGLPVAIQFKAVFKNGLPYTTERFAIAPSQHPLRILDDKLSTFFTTSRVLKTVDLQNAVAHNVTSLERVFSSIRTLTTVNLSGLQIPNVTSVRAMFESCDQLTTVNLAGMDTGAVTNMKQMFAYCKSLTSFDLSVLNGASVTDLSEFFKNCTSLSEIQLAGFNSANVMDINHMFSGTALTEIDLSVLDFGNVMNMSGLFSLCSNLMKVVTTNQEGVPLDTRNVNDLSGLFKGCSQLSGFDFTQLNTSLVTNVSELFLGCINLKSFDLSQLDMTSVMKMSAMFKECTSLGSVNLIGAQTANVTDMSELFADCRELTTISFTNQAGAVFDTSAVRNMKRLFSGCSNLREIDLHPLDLTNVTTMEYLFKHCSSLKEINLAGLNLPNVKSMEFMFESCTNLQKADLRNLATPSLTNVYCMFSSCTNLTQVEVAGFDTSAVTGMKLWFWGCKNLREIDLSSLDTSSATSYSCMFEACSELTKVNLAGWATRGDQYFASNLFSMNHRLTDLTISADFKLAEQQKLPETLTSDLRRTLWQDGNQGYTTSEWIATHNEKTTGTFTYHLQEQYQVRFDTAGAEAIEPFFVEAGAKVAEPELQWTGHHLVKWQTLVDPADLNSEWQTYDFAIPVTGPLALQAVWAANHYRVIFDANGGKGSMANQELVYDQVQALQANAFSNKQKGTMLLFAGWNTEKDGSGTFYQDEEEVMNLMEEAGAITLYAQWLGAVTGAEKPATEEPVIEELVNEEVEEKEKEPEYNQLGEHPWEKEAAGKTNQEALLVPTTTGTTPSGKKQFPVTEKTANQRNRRDILPKTGEKKGLGTIILGLLLWGSLVVFYQRRKKA